MCCWASSVRESDQNDLHHLTYVNVFNYHFRSCSTVLWGKRTPVKSDVLRIVAYWWRCDFCPSPVVLHTDCCRLVGWRGEGDAHQPVWWHGLHHAEWGEQRGGWWWHHGEGSRSHWEQRLPRYKLTLTHTSTHTHTHLSGIHHFHTHHLIQCITLTYISRN